MFTAALIGLAACSSNPKPRALPPQTMAPEAPESEEAVSNSPQELGVEQIPNRPASASEPTAGPTVAGPTVEPVAPPAAGSTVEGDAEDEDEDSITVVIESPTGEGEAQELSLYAAAQAERKRRAQAEHSSIVLDDKNLKQYSKGNLTEMDVPADGDNAGSVGSVTGVGEDGVGEEDAATHGEAREASAAEADSPGEGDPIAPEDEATRLWRQEQYWRNRVLDLRQAWRQSLDRIVELEGRAAELRRDFYAEDDPFYRDSQIKPAWDRVLDELDGEKHAAERHGRELDRAMEEGRREGALPGWLREGIELEPTEDEVSETVGRDGKYYEPTEPVVADEDGG